MLKHFRHRCVVVLRLHVIRFLQLIRVLRFGFLALLGLHGHIHPLLLDLLVAKKKFGHRQASMYTIFINRSFEGIISSHVLSVRGKTT